MRKNYFFAISCVFFVLFSCKNEDASIPEKGVSLALNDQREREISDIHYKIELDIPESKNASIRGTEVISFQLNSTENAVVLDFSADSSQILSIQSDGKEVSYSFVNEHIIISQEILRKGKNEIRIDFVAGDMSLNRSDEYLYTLFVPDRASTCFPLFDQPNLKSVYTLTLITPAAWEAVSNGGLKSKIAKNRKAVYEFEKTKPISSYLFAFATGKFFKATKSVNGTSMTMYYRETDTVKVARNASAIFSLHAKSRVWLEDYTAIKYPFGKFDFVLLPSFQYGGMEHPGSIFYNESALFLDENASVNKKMARASVIAHETAHMWFGDLVTMAWFNDVWLKEVFANFMAAKIVHPSFPEINHNLRFLLAHYPAAYEVDRTAGANPVLQDLGNLKNAGTLYGAIIYQKAPIVMRQLEKKIGEKLMRDSLREYLKTYAFGNAKWDDLVGIIDKKTPLHIASWSDVWIKTPGMPEYDFSFSELKSEIGQRKDSVSGRIWQQPLRIKWLERGNYKDSLFEFNDNLRKGIPINSAAFVFPNADGVAYGYFKMNEETSNFFVKNYNKKSDSVLIDPVFRGAMLVNQWEGLLRGDAGSAERYLKNLTFILPKEENPLLADYLLGNLQTCWWSFLSEKQRSAEQKNLEHILWKLMSEQMIRG